MTPPTAPDTGAIKKRLEKITPGEWHIVRYGDGDSLVVHSDTDKRVCFMATPGSMGDPAKIRADADFIAHAPADMAALLAEVESRWWRPIETAPKDGTYILAYQVLNQVACVVSWQRTRGWLGFWRMPMTNEAAPYDPTHWMPLPEPPQAKEGDTP